jgi:hypothetical protein
MIEILTLQSYVVLYPAFDSTAYGGAKATTDPFGTPLSMHVDRYKEYQYALYCARRLSDFLDTRFDLSYPPGNSDEAYDSVEDLMVVRRFNPFASDIKK